MSIAIVIFMYAVWSSVFPLGKLTLEYCSPLFLTAIRMILAGGLLLGYLSLRQRSSFKVNAKQMLSLTLLAIFGYYLTNACEFWSLQHLSAAKTCFIYGLSPFFAAFFSYLHFGEKMNRRKWLGLGVGVLGILPILALQTGSEDLIGGFLIFSWPEIAMIAAVLCSVYGWVLLRLVVKDSVVSPLMANGTSMLIGGALALIHSYLIEPWTPIPVVQGGIPSFIQGTLLLTFISNILCTNLYGLMLKRFTATFLSFVGLLSPIFASFSSWLFLNEQPSLLIFLSTGVLLVGLWLVYSAELKQGYIPQKTASAAA